MKDYHELNKPILKEFNYMISSEIMTSGKKNKAIISADSFSSEE
jgi:hypothetical protein